MQPANAPGATRALVLSTIAFTVCFAIWTIFSIIGLRLKIEFMLSDSQFGILLGAPILVGSLSRVFLGSLSDRLGGRRVLSLVMLAGAIATFLLSFASSYLQLLIAGCGVGLAGGSFAVGVSYVARFYAPSKQGAALGIFGMGNVGAAVTKFVAPFVMVALGWQATAQVWSLALALCAIGFWFLAKEDPVSERREAHSGTPRVETPQYANYAILKDVRVWRFSLYYFFAFGGFVALALWLPAYLVGYYQMDIKTAGMIAAAYSIPGSLFRAYGGILSDRHSARSITQLCLVMSICSLVGLVLPIDIGIFPFIALLFILGVGMSFGKASVYKYIPQYYPGNVGVVGGVVGMVGGLGGFVLPILFGYMLEVTGDWRGCFQLLAGLAVVSLLWLRVTVRQIQKSERIQSRSAAA